MVECCWALIVGVGLVLLTSVCVVSMLMTPVAINFSYLASSLGVAFLST